MIHLIQGFFFQERESLDIVHGAESEGGSRPVIRFDVCKFMFAGLIFPHPDNPNEIIGEMQDHFGVSQLSSVRMTEEKLDFVKTYVNSSRNRGQSYDITYKFQRQGDVWVGEFFGPMTGAGRAKCVLTEAPAALFVSPK